MSHRPMTLSEYLIAEKETPSAFARSIGCPPSTITRIIKGERNPSLPLMRKIRSATKGKVDFLAAEGAAG